MNLIEELVEVTLPSEESFLKVKETLTRIGIASKKEQKLLKLGTELKWINKA